MSEGCFYGFILFERPSYHSLLPANCILFSAHLDWNLCAFLQEYHCWEMESVCPLCLDVLFTGAADTRESSAKYLEYLICLQEKSCSCCLTTRRLCITSSTSRTARCLLCWYIAFLLVCCIQWGHFYFLTSWDELGLFKNRRKSCILYL